MWSWQISNRFDLKIFIILLSAVEAESHALFLVDGDSKVRHCSLFMFQVGTRENLVGLGYLFSSFFQGLVKTILFLLGLGSKIFVIRLFGQNCAKSMKNIETHTLWLDRTFVLVR